MTGTNHAMTGGVIGLAIGGPLAIPVAFASHFVCDWLPHYGEEVDDRIKNRAAFLRIAAVDAVLLTTGFVAIIYFALPWYVFAAAIAAMIPDFVWVYRYVFDEKIGTLPPKKKNRFNQWHADIQTRETTSAIGVWTEVLWFTSMSIIAIYLL